MDKSKIANQLVDNAQLILDELKKGETSDNEVFCSQTHEVKVNFEHKDFSLSASSSSDMYGVRSIVGGRLGFMTSNSSDPENLKSVAREAQQMARLSIPSEHHRISTSEETAGGKLGDHAIWDKQLAEMAPKDLYHWADLVVAEATADPKIAIDRAEISLRMQVWAMVNSNGVVGTACQTSADWYTMGMGKTKEEVTSFDYDGGSVSELGDLESEIKRTMGDFRTSVLGSLGVKKGRTYKGPVLFHPQAVMGLIGGLVSANCNGYRMQDGLSSWKDKMGQKVMSETLTVYEDPANKQNAEGWSPFDREGIPTQKHVMVDAGKMNFAAHHCFSAHRGGVKPTGNAQGGSRSLPQIGFSNVVINGSGKVDSQVSHQDLLKQLGDGLVLKRFSGNSDMTSGQFSGVAKNSWWVKDAAKAFPVSEVMVSGDLFDLVHRVQAVDKDLMKLMGGARAPYVLIDGVSVTAG